MFIYNILLLYPFLSQFKVYKMKQEMTPLLTIPQDSDFSMHNIPFGVFHLASETAQQARCATRIGDFVVDLASLEAAGHITVKEGESPVFNQVTLNAFMDYSRTEWRQVRQTIISLFSAGSAIAEQVAQGAAADFLFNISEVTMLLPAQVGDYTDFYSSYNHAYNLGCMFRGPENALQPNWLWLPVGYHGRASSVVVSGTDIVRPASQKKFARTDAEPVFAKSSKMDYELEIGAFVGNKGNKLGQPIDIKDAQDYIFGITLMNDWSARDLQGWEYVPLGPFTAKNLGTVISPWIVTLEALEPFRTPLPEPKQPFMKYLQDPSYTSFDIGL